MKHTKFSKIASLLLAITLVVGAFFAMGVVAGADAESSLGYANVEFGDTIKLAFTVEGAATGIVVYKDEAGTDLFSRDTTPETHNGVTYYTSKGIAAKDIDTTYYVGVIDANGNVGELKGYSVLDYVTAIETSSDNENQLALCAKIRAYNEAANAIFDK